MTRYACLIGLLALAGCYAGADGTGASVPRSLAGTQIDGTLRAGADEGFVFDAEARLGFDYFLTADRELSRAEIDGWVRAELGRRLPARAANEGYAAWEAYVSFREEAAEALAEPLAGTGAELAAVERRLLAAVDEQLGEYPIAAEEKAAISRGFALRRISMMQGEARERALAELVGDAASGAAAFVTARRTIAAAGAEERQALRSEHFGAEAADRLAALDERRMAWTRRVEAFRGEREALGRELGGAALGEAIAALEGRTFSAEELRRVRALDRLAVTASE